MRPGPQGGVLVGPESVGYRITSEALVFGGTRLTTTDISVASGAIAIGDPKSVASLPREMVAAAQSKIKTMLELTLDSMKTSNAVSLTRGAMSHLFRMSPCTSLAVELSSRRTPCEGSARCTESPTTRVRMRSERQSPRSLV